MKKIISTPNNLLDTIKAIHTTRVKESAASPNLALEVSQMHKVLGKDGFMYTMQFYMELIQNADDAFVNSGDKISVQFRLLEINKDDNYLVILHSGRHFSQRDVEKICRTHDKDNEKIFDPETTGCKGVGFKTLFTRSDQVMIETSGVRFRFEKGYWQDPNIPWRITPIEGGIADQNLDTCLKSLKETFTKDQKTRPVVIVMKLNPDIPSVQIEREFRILASKESRLKTKEFARSLLFLRRIESINFGFSQANDIAEFLKSSKRTLGLY